MEEEPKTHVKTYDWLKPHQFVEGNPGGPGRPKGPTLKTWIKNHFEQMTDEERATFLNKVDPIKAWEMGEGKPDTKTDIMSDGKALPAPIIPLNVQGDNSNSEDSSSK